MTTVDDPLLVGVHAGAPNWNAIYATYREAMLRTAVSMLGHDDPSPSTGMTVLHRGVSAMDIVSEVVHRLQRRGIPRDIYDLRNYLITATVNEVRDTLRRSMARRQDEYGQHWERREESLDRGHDPDLADDFVDASVDVEGIALANVLREQVIGHLHILSDNERHAFVQSVFHQRQAKDIAKELGVTPQRIPQLIRAAGTRLARKLGKLEEGNDV